MKPRIKIWHRFIPVKIVVIIFISFFAGSDSFSQSPSDTNIVFTDLNEALKNPEYVYHLDLSKKKLEDFPMDVLKFKNLRTLNLFKNKIDSVPSQISELKQLTELNIGHNKLMVFSKSICELVNLEKLVLNQNSIESIPAEVKNLKKMHTLDMWDNELWFFPDELAELSETLKVLDLQNMQYNFEEQAKVRALLPKTKINWPPPCNCKD